MNDESARSRLEKVLDEIERYPLCGPSDDTDEQTAVVYGFRSLLMRLKRSARVIADDRTRADVQEIPMPDDICGVYDATAAVGAMAGDVRDALWDEGAHGASPKGDIVDWRSNPNLLFEALRELAAHGSDVVLRDVLNEGTPEITENNHDGWNGGTTYYTMAVSIPPHLFVRIEDRLDAIEKKILERVGHLTRAETHDFVNIVVVQPRMTDAQRVMSASETPFWLPGHFKLFISHLSVDKRRATNLRGALKSFAISSFVAHEDIEPTKEWQVEIEKALFSMDALAAVLTEEFHQSKWTDQEVGVALGRGVTVLPIRAGVDPYGLMGKFQGIASTGRSLGEVASLVVSTLLRNAKTRNRLVSCLVEQLLASADAAQAASKLEVLEQAEEVASDQLIRIRDNAATNPNLFADVSSRRRIDALLAKYGVEPIHAKTAAEKLPDDDIPF
ncbi:MAG TPA: toll/interleukin-1 receptor domain-containing protein [Pirellulales bacterium]|nr:toll/interleukin-1 receptor domain-containing protein [Pirellulales bacterium]